MANCEKISTCIFFNNKMSDMPTIAEIYKEKFCKGNNSLCARYMVLAACGMEKVPNDLFPNDREKAKEVIALEKNK